MSPFCTQSTIDDILFFREQLRKAESHLAQVGEEALLHYNREIGGTNPIGGWKNARLSSEGTHLVYDIGGGIIELIHIEFLLNPDEFITKHRERKAELDRAVSNEEADCSSQADHNYVVTNYP